MSQPTATILAALILAAAILLVFRWEVSVSAGVVRLDRWTGNVSICLGDSRSACD